MHRAIKYGLPLIALAAGAALGPPMSDTPAPAAQPAPPVPVVVAPVQQHEVPIILSGLGTMQALNTATVRSQVSGLLQTINFIEGQQVHRGDILAQIDPRPYQARLEQAQAQLARDQAHLANAQANLNRFLPLARGGYATEQQVTDQKSLVAQTQSTVQFDQAAIDDARTQLSYTTLIAPFDGVTGVRLVDVGNIIHPTDPNGLVVVTQVQPIAVMFTLPAAAIAQVQQALSKGPVQAVVYDQAGTQALDTGRLLLVNNRADPMTGMVQLKALFPNPERRLWPGTFVNVELTTAMATNGLTVPTNAVQLGAQGEFAFVVGPDGKAEVRPVHVAQRYRGEALIAEGLKPGEMVVTQGQYRVTAGTPVASSDPSKVADSSTATAGMLP
ncbi:MAG TPA: efflux RND transporter periplasmic adaptor subunit [Crenalkalicoccus sp.]|nr:efflux RND transporter periplasmic adaptor subunit [Crenalkalicoccus sp.]